MEILQEPEFWVGLGFVAIIGIVIWRRVPAFAAAALDTRAAAIAKELDEAKRLREEAAALLAQFRTKAADAEKEAASIVTEAKAEAERFAIEA
ncbi:MAG TPA: ATP F0F1 synthase subunit B, partial [Rhizomicrobium sp.]|nr:ATP F0F1 synthase subunit B [Rhizomicrobium sp.]